MEIKALLAPPKSGLSTPRKPKTPQKWWVAWRLCI